ncbi:hypothetical protein ATE92_0148 [Ulvibacter sp. MAR_2010_11]|uniref:hypothetical protein n=1 Tax=Ulvibacter sp. MAR_2010_11 TaxID=1250229 RepID=UPI000CC916D5|nr:hypothetical protein [Ulvibacter sp. MAR_2010_11]PKA82024.1 hypothetical protein ATE92_0148 [Ulvibacter sp. MAR_2010_11]
MKQLLIIITAIAFMSCGNQKNGVMEANTHTPKSVKKSRIIPPKAIDFVKVPLETELD